MRIILIILLLMFTSIACADITGTGISITGTTVSSDSNGYSKAITITGSSDGILTNYPIPITVNYADGSDSGTNVYLNGKCQPDFDDIRFTSDGTTEIDYWIEYTSDASKALVWVEVPSIAASPSTTTIYLHYNNFAVNDEGDGHNVFTSFLDYTDVDSFTTNPTYITIDRPYTVGTKVNVTDTAADREPNPFALKLANGDWIVAYEFKEGITTNNDNYTVLKKSTDQGATWGSQITVYDDPTPHRSYPAGLIQTDDGTIHALARTADMSGEVNDYKEDRTGTSTDNGATWTAAASWTEAYAETDNHLGIPNDWLRIGDNWYAIAGAFEDDHAFSDFVKFDGTTFSIVSMPTQTPNYTSEGGVGYLGGNNLFLISREKAGTLNNDASTKTIKMTSSDLGATWSAQEEVTSTLGLFHDPDITLVSGTPGDGLYMLHGRQGPNTDGNGDAVAWFSSDNGVTWGNKTVFFQTFDNATSSDGGYTSVIMDEDITGYDGALFAWTDEDNENAADIKWRPFNLTLQDTLEVHGYSNAVIDNVYTTDFNSSGLTKFVMETRAKMFETPDAYNFNFSAMDTSEDNQMIQFWMLYPDKTIRYDLGEETNDIYDTPDFDTYYVMSASVDMDNTGKEIDWRLYNEDRSTRYGQHSDKPFGSGTPTEINLLHIGPDSPTHRTLGHVDYLLIRKWTTNEPSITSWGAETVTAYP